MGSKASILMSSIVDLPSTTCFAVKGTLVVRDRLEGGSMAKSTDFREGNIALGRPMELGCCLGLFDMLVLGLWLLVSSRVIEVLGYSA